MVEAADPQVGFPAADMPFALFFATLSHPSKPFAPAGLGLLLVLMLLFIGSHAAAPEPIQAGAAAIESFIARYSQAHRELGLRSEMQAREGAGFDIREFHDRVLKHGPLPLSLLRERVLATPEVRVQAQAAAQNSAP